MSAVNLSSRVLDVGADVRARQARCHQQREVVECARAQRSPTGGTKQRRGDEVTRRKVAQAARGSRCVSVCHSGRCESADWLAGWLAGCPACLPGREPDRPRDQPATPAGPRQRHNSWFERSFDPKLHVCAQAPASRTRAASPSLGSIDLVGSSYRAEEGILVEFPFWNFEATAAPGSFGSARWRLDQGRSFRQPSAVSSRLECEIGKFGFFSTAQPSAERERADGSLRNGCAKGSFIVASPRA